MTMQIFESNYDEENDILFLEFEEYAKSNTYEEDLSSEILVFRSCWNDRIKRMLISNARLKMKYHKYLLYEYGLEIDIEQYLPKES